MVAIACLFTSSLLRAFPSLLLAFLHLLVWSMFFKLLSLAYKGMRAYTFDLLYWMVKIANFTGEIVKINLQEDRAGLHAKAPSSRQNFLSCHSFTFKDKLISSQPKIPDCVCKLREKGQWN